MADEAKVTPEAEKIAPKEGSVAAEVAKEAPKEAPKTEVVKEEPQTVPLSVYLSLKDDLKELRKDIRDSKDSKKPGIVLEGVKELSEKYPDVSKDFISDMLSAATTQAEAAAEKKYTPFIQKQEQVQQQEAFNRAFDKVFSEAIKDNPDLPKNIDKEAIKSLALTPAYQNVPIVDILKKLYGTTEKGTETTENDMRPAGDAGDEVIDFAKMNSEQKDKVLENPASRKKYFAYLDTL